MESHRPQIAGIIWSERQKWQAMQREVAFERLRYTSHIDTSYPKDDWTCEEEEEMFNLNNELGNKWAIIGSKLGGKYLSF